jgi:ribonuclease-3
MKISRELEAFAARLGHRFADPALLVQAVTHPSMAAGTGGHNQRLEFLGDRVLNLLIAEALFKADVQAAEGTLAPRYNALVRKETCAEIARGLDLGAVLKLGRSEMQSGGRRKDALVADALEAVLAAVYLDAGLDAARDIVLRLWGDRIVKAETHVSNAKSE